VKAPGIVQRAARWLAGTPPPALQVRRFEGARIDRLTADWHSTEASINQELQSDLNRLRSRGRQLGQNNDYARKFRGMVGNNIIGPGGIRLQVKVEDAPGKPDRLANDAIEAAWSDWSRACDVTGHMSLRDLCESLVESLPSDGEFLVRMVRGADARNRFNFALQVIDVDRIDTSYNGQHGGNAVIMGVEVDDYRRPVGLHLFVAHPNDGSRSGRQRVRIDAGEVLHRFKVERAEQMRGIPWMAPGMLSMHHLGAFKLAALLAAEHGANHYGFFKQGADAAPGPAIGVAETDGDTTIQIAASQPGIYDTLPVGYEFQAHESKYPEAYFGPFVQTTLQRIASGWRVAYHSLANNLEGVSFSSIRSGTLEERDRWMADQEWFIGAFMEPVFQAWLQMALLSDAITMPNGSALPSSKIAKFAKHEWQPRRWEWVDPKSDMEAKILSVRAGLMAPQDLSAAMGYDFEDVLKAISEAQKLAKTYNVMLTAYEATPGAVQAQPQPKADPAQQAKEAEALLNASAHAQRQADQTHSTLAALTAAVQASATRQPAAPVVNIHQAPITVNTPEVRVLVPETTINVEAILPAPVIEVRTDAPIVNITNDVRPAPVTVNNAHPARAVQVVERDKNDEIVQTVTTYTAS
jgi:lambda family phage portal protein